jgi:iron complex outermembrane receptor protein
MKKHNLKLLVTASLAALAFPVAAQAQSTQDEATPAADTGAQDKGGADIIVTAQRRAQRLQDVPESISVQTGAELERQQVNTVADLSRVAPSLEIQQAPGQSVGGGGQIRGIGTQSFQQGAVGSVGIVVDGVSQGNANIADLFDIERVEVLKGPQGTLFGLTTSAGVINITTTAPKFDTFSARVRTELSKAGTAGSDFGRQLIQGVVNIPLAPNAAIRVAGNANLTQGVDFNTLTGRYDPHRTYGGRARLRWEPNDRLSANLIGDYTKVDDDGVDFFTLYRGDTSAIPVGNPGFPPGTTSLTDAAASCGVTPGAGNRKYCSATPGYTKSETWGSSLQVDYRADPFTITSITSYRHQNATGSLNIFRLDPLLSKITLPPVPGQIIDGPKPYDSSLFTQELRVASPTGSTVEYTAGLFFSSMRQHNDPEQVTITIPIPFAPPVQTVVPGTISTISDDSMAIFGQATIHVTQHLNLIAGGRYTAERLSLSLYQIGATAASARPKLNTENFSWKLGAQYEFSHDLTAYGTVARGYKGGQIALGDPTDPTSVPTIIRPEIPTAYELGLKASTLDGKLGVDLSGFYTTIKDYQGQQCTPAAGGGLNCLPQNISGVKSRGVELSVFGRPTKYVSLNLGGIWNKVTYPGGFVGQDGSDLGGLQLQSAPKWKVTATGEVSQPIGSLEAFVAGDAVYKSSLRLAASTNPLTIYGPHVTLGGRIGIREADGGWSASIFARNLTDNHEPVVRYLNFPDGTAGVGQILTSQAFRQVGLQLEAKF